MRGTYIDRELCIFLVLMLKTVRTLNWSEHFVRWGYFQIYIGNNNTSLLLYASEVIYLINKGMILPYVQE